MQPVQRHNLNKLQSYSLPSGSYVNLTLGASDSQYTAPADGWFFLSMVATSQLGFLLMYSPLKIIGTGSIARATTNADGIRAYLPVQKGDIIKVAYYDTRRTEYFIFIYAAGSEPQT